jgi:hypothetical protein
MQESHEKNALLHFHHSHKSGNKYIHQYTVEEIWAPGDPEPRKVLKRLERNKENPVLSREEVLEAINEWHHHNGHLAPWSRDDMEILQSQVLECHPGPCQALLPNMLYMSKEKPGYQEAQGVHQANFLEELPRQIPS